jgi:hypothetical protein
MAMVTRAKESSPRYVRRDSCTIAQARDEGMAILTADEQPKKYDVPTIW